MEYEVISHGVSDDLKVVLNDIVYRTPHLHRELEVMLVISGEMSISCGETYTVRTGDIVVFSPWDVHSFSSISDKTTALLVQTGCRFYAGYFPGVERISIEGMKIRDHLTEEMLHELRSDMIRLARIYYSAQPLYELDCIDKMNRICSIILKNVPWSIKGDDETRKKTSINQRLQRIISYTEQNFDRKLLLGEIAENENVTVSYLSHLIKDNLNMPFQEYLAILRFNKAKTLIERSKFPLSDIALLCGFSDMKYLNMVFKKQVGVTPAEYRKNNLRINTKNEAIPANTTEYIYTPEECVEYLQQMS